MITKEFTLKLSSVQAALRVPKDMFNSFGNYKYRNAETILEELKPLLLKEGLILTMADEVMLVGDRFYIKATATVSDGECEISASALAREALTKKGADEGQITGMCSSYARKYALCGLFAIGSGEKDFDALDNGEQTKPDNKQTQRKQTKKPEVNPRVKEAIDRVNAANTMQEIQVIVDDYPELDDNEELINVITLKIGQL